MSNENGNISWPEAANKALKELGVNKKKPNGNFGYHYKELAKYCFNKSIKIPRGEYSTEKELIHQAGKSLTAQVGRTIRGETLTDPDIFIREPGGFISLTKWKKGIELSKGYIKEKNISTNIQETKSEISSLNELLDEVFEEVRVDEKLLSKLRNYSDTQFEHLVASLLSDIYLRYNCYITREKGRGPQPLGDIILQRSSPISDEIEYIMVEVKGGKLPEKPRVITINEINAFVGKMYGQGVFDGIFVTTGMFSSEAENLALKLKKKDKMSLKLVDGDRLIQIWTERMRLKGKYEYVKS